MRQNLQSYTDSLRRHDKSSKDTSTTIDAFLTTRVVSASKGSCWDSRGLSITNDKRTPREDISNYCKWSNDVIILSTIQPLACTFLLSHLVVVA